MGILEKLKDQLGDVAEEQLEKLKSDIASKIDDIVEALNKSIDVPFINEKMEAKGLNFLYDVFEEKIKSAVKKAL